MSYIDKLQHHQRLMTRMAEQNGADVAIAEQVGLISPEEVFEATLACSGCSAVQACEAHLDQGVAGLPGYCRNADMIGRLAKDMDEFGLSET